MVRSTTSGFELIAGERRLRAAKEAGLERVPVLIRQAGENESMELALVENLQRENLSPLETAAAYQALIDGFGLSKEQLAHRLGKSRAAVTNTLRLTHLPERVRALLGEGKLSEGHARALLGLQTEEQMLQTRADGSGREALREKDRRAGPRKTLQPRRNQQGRPPGRERHSARVRRGLPPHP